MGRLGHGGAADWCEGAAWLRQGLLKDEAAVRAGLSLVWSNGPTEGFIHRLKLIKRQAYGRAGVDFLRHRILASSAGAAA